VDDATLGRLKAAGAMVEFNLGSNFALTNIQHSREVPLRRYVRAGVPVVLGSDGYGIYRTDLGGEVRAARLVGLGEEDLGHIRASEEGYLAKREVWDRGLEDFGAYEVPDDAPPQHFTPQVEARKREARELQAQAWAARLAELGVPRLDEEGLRGRLRGKEVISFAGPWRKSWPQVSEGWRARIVALLEEVFDKLDPKRVVVLSGGTRHGLEGVVGGLARARGVEHIGVLVRALPPESLEGGVDAVCFVAESFYDKAAALYGLMGEHGGVCVFIGGGNVVNDEIQVARNLRVRHLLMRGPEGASTKHAEQHPERAFETAAELLDALTVRVWASVSEPYWHLGANPTVDAVVLRACAQTGRPQVLLIRRAWDAPVEAGRWALPGGFVHTDAPRGEPWREGAEGLREACVREVLEEAGLDLRPWASALVEVGAYEGGGRDPRDSAQAWSRSTAFAVRLTQAQAQAPILGGDDACEAAWFDLDEVPVNLAFDHDRILQDALRRLDGLEAARLGESGAWERPWEWVGLGPRGEEGA
jgi:ADP-ribose pyrophosphatase YjhB (NUDIX family)